MGKGVDGSKFDASKKRGMWATAAGIARQEGIGSLYGGVEAAVIRQAVYGGIGVGLYQPVRKLIMGNQDPKDASLP